MADTSTSTPDSRVERSKSVTAPILFDMADTTWRLFVPTIGLLLVGRHYDGQFGTKPWLMLVGAAVGAIIAGLLVRSQLKRGGVK